MPAFANITTLNAQNAPRLHRAIFVLERDLLVVPNADDTYTIRQEISLAANATSYALYHTRESEEFSERKMADGAGVRYEQALRIAVPRSRADIDATLAAIGNNRVAVAFMDRNGTCRLVRKMRLQHDLTISTNNQYQLTFASESTAFSPYLTQNVFTALAGDAEYIEDENVINDPDPLAIGEKLFVWYSAATAATYAAQRDWYIDLGASVLRIKGDVRLTSLATGTETGIVAYDADNKLLKSQLITISAGNLGIGITNPERKLHVVGTTRPALFGSDNAVNIVKFYNSATGKNSLQGFDIVVNSTGSAQLSSYNLPLIFAVSNALNTAVSPALTINKDKSIKYDAYGTGAITGTESTFAAFQSDGKLIEYTLQDFFALVPEYATNVAAAAVLAVGETYYNTTTATYTKVI